MIKKSMYCFYFNKFKNPLKFVQFKNIGDFTIKCIVQYTLNNNTITKTAVLLKNHIAKIELPVDAFNICLNIDRKSTRLNSSHANISYAVFCLKKKNKL